MMKNTMLMLCLMVGLITLYSSHLFSETPSQSPDAAKVRESQNANPSNNRVFETSAADNRQTVKKKTEALEKRRAIKKKYPPELEKRMAENRKLLETAKTGKDKDLKYVRLTPENQYMDRVSDKLIILRDGTSGPGTGRFTGRGFVFCKGGCDDLPKEGDKQKKYVRWVRKINQCRQRILESDWCAKAKDNPLEMYTIRILAWPIEQSSCVGDCVENDYKTAYLRIKSK